MADTPEQPCVSRNLPFRRLRSALSLMWLAAPGFQDVNNQTPRARSRVSLPLPGSSRADDFVRGLRE